MCWLCIHCQDVKRTHQPPAIIPRPRPRPAVAMTLGWGGWRPHHVLDNQQLHHVMVVWRLATLLTIASIYFILSETLLHAYTEISFVSLYCYFRMSTCDFRISIGRLVYIEIACVHDISSVQVKSRSFYPNNNIHTYLDLA